RKLTGSSRRVKYPATLAYAEGQMDIGARLQLVRKSKDLSQRELAKRVGVTNSTISLIEQNKVSPSVSSLKKVLDGIPISLADFFTLDLDIGLPDSPFYSAGELPDV